MIRWPKIGLFGQFEPCEEGILERINDNFATLDQLVQETVLDFVTELPDDPEEGDAYILEPGVYAYDGDPGSIMWFDGEDWIEIVPLEGWEIYDETTAAFYYFNGAGWVARPIGSGDVIGPGSSTDNAVARFDGITGKFIQNSGVIISDTNVMTGLTGIYSDYGSIDDLKVVKFSGLVSSNAQAGTAVAVTLPTTLITKFTGALVSIDSIAAPPVSTYGRLHIFVNKRGSLAKVKFLNNANIRTGTGADLDVSDGAAVWAYYDNTDAQWVIVGGSGGGSAPGSVTTIATLTAGGTIPLAADINDQSFLIEGASAPVSLNSIPFTVATTVPDAAMIYLIGTSDDKPVTITWNDASGGVVGNFSTITLHKNEVMVIKKITAISRYVYVP